MSRRKKPTHPHRQVELTFQQLNYYKAYKSFDGIQVATKTKQMKDGKLIPETEVADFRAADKPDAKLFEQP